MAASPSDRFAEHALDLFSTLGRPVTVRRMFGGLGFYAGGLFFAIGDHEQGLLWLKVDEESRAAFEAAGGRPFTYTVAGRESVTMAYLTPPEGALEDAEAMLPWAMLGVAAADRAAASKGARPARTTRKGAGTGRKATTTTGTRSQGPKSRKSASKAPATRARAGRRSRRT